jgi:hypothetical protein
MVRLVINLAFTLIFVSRAAAFAAAVPYTRVLLPLYVETPIAGAYGSQWQSHFTIHNSGAINYFLETCTLVGSISSDGCNLVGIPDEELLTNETQTGLPGRYPKPNNGAAGTVLYLYPDPVAGAGSGDPHDISFELRITDLSRNATSAGTEVPVVRENQFRSSTLRLLDVPSDARFRPALRLFEMNLDQASFTVRVLDQDTNAVLLERQVATSTPPQPITRFRPGFVEIRDIVPPGAQPTSLRIEIDPQTTGSAFWAYVAITNNDSQQVTLVTPQ